MQPRWGLWVALGVLGGCGRFRFLDLADASFDGRPDAPPDSPPPDACALGPWGSPQVLSLISSPNFDFGPQISPDGLTLYFDSDRTGNRELFVAPRVTRGDSFASTSQIGELGSPQLEGSASATADQLEIFFTSDRSGSQCLYTATRASVTAMWNPPTELTTLCPAAGAYVTPDGLTLYYEAVSDSNGLGTIVVTQRATRMDAFTPGSPIAALQSGPLRGYPSLSGDGLTLYFEEYAPGLQLRQSTRPDLASAFSASMTIPDFVDGATDVDPSITADGQELYFSSARAGNQDLYVMTRSCI